MANHQLINRSFSNRNIITILGPDNIVYVGINLCFAQKSLREGGPAFDSGVTGNLWLTCFLASLS